MEQASQSRLRGFTAAQLYSTSSYQQKNLAFVRLTDNDLTGWDFRGQNLSGASLTSTTLTGADLTGAEIVGGQSRLVDQSTSMERTTSRGFTKEQLYSTASYQRKDLSFMSIGNNDFSGWDFSGIDLTRTRFGGATLLNTDFTGALIERGSFDRTTSLGFSARAALQHR